MEPTHTSDRPVFMSPEHVQILNRRLRDGGFVARTCSELERDLSLRYELQEGPGGETVCWRVDFKRSAGIQFSLAPGGESADVVIAGRYWDVIDAVQGTGAIPTPRGDAANIEAIMKLLTSPEMLRYAVPVVFPTRTAQRISGRENAGEGPSSAPHASGPKEGALDV